MRPLRLELEGLTSFADRTVIDFTELQLFAITGPTGAGKSSLIDAMLLALFGKAPRIGREYGQLISHGMDQLSVLLEFEARGGRYRVARRIKLKGAGDIRLERLTATGVESIAGKAREVEAAITDILGIDYEACIRSVVLPQGQFDQFLKGDRKDRRGILVDLLGLSLYERMARVAGERQRDLQARAAAAAQRLQQDFADATAERLQQLQQDQQATAATQRQLGLEAEQLAAAADAALQLRQARQRAQETAKELTQLRRDHDAAAEAVEAAQRRSDSFASDRRALEQQASELAFDPARSLQLASALPLLAQLQRQAAALPAADDEAARTAAAVTKAEQELARAEAALPQLHATVDERMAEVAEAEAALARQQLADAALHLRAQLHDGDACPVCAQTIAKVPAATPTAVPGAKAALDAARKDLQAAERLRDDTARTGKQKHKELGELRRTAELAAARRDDAQVQLRQLQSSLQDLGIAVAADAAADLHTRLAAEQTQLQQSAARHAELQAQLARLLEAHGQRQQQLAAAAARLELLQRQLQQQQTAAAAADTAATAAQQTFAAALAATGAALEPLRQGVDEAAQLQQRQQQNARQRDLANHRAGQQAQQQEQLQAAIAAAARLRQQGEQLAADAALARSLAQMLHGDRFLDFVQEAAMQLLTEDGARHLLQLSHGRYSLHYDGNDFRVADHWNADRERSVKTLSGGETFLASLALALGLAERIVGMSAQHGGGASLECLFVDEGFGALDGESLEAAVQALEMLQGGNRMVGVVTHLPQLAERLPARLSVETDAGKARVVVA